ncbi:hypothetical protein OD91_0379 [Lutibacter sp. Hel_I_33_5]|uniref:type 1 periplasmic binding fold superfamily protein n=1 Tax=Lutibacter sp. Hel_I_33_5 TaxID=1566289 RepID=UPI0011ABCDAB|nr:type 1 periplasmic binding fold superfamily protein [Lutibacter sp. Hel_I_33_5]TVZ55136.1 hypothetical protein OD91_0379 [Lutibacter sp. Hel_I_33_5]
MKNINTIKTIKLLAILFISALTFTACTGDDHDDDDHDHGEELITTVTYTLTNGNDVVTLTFLDLDGEGGNAGTYTISGPLTAKTTYRGVIKLENATESPAEDITAEVKAEGDEHEFFYTSGVSSITIAKTDKDGNGNPLGIETTLSTAAAGSGTITVILKHEPTKPNDGSSSNAGGSTDVEVTFNVTVQ